VWAAVDGQTLFIATSRCGCAWVRKFPEIYSLVVATDRMRAPLQLVAAIATSGKNRPLVTNEPVEIPNCLIELKIFGK